MMKDLFGNTISLSFDKAEMKDLIIHQMVSYMKENWSDDEIIDLFHNPQFKFYEPEKSQYKIALELMQVQKEAVNHLIEFKNSYYSIDKWKSGDYNLSELFAYDLSKVDIRFLDEIETITEKPIQIITDFIVDNFLKKTGILISENILATRLGIDKDKSADWPKIIRKLEQHQYIGVFSESWTRWWMSGLENWWSSEFQIDNSLRSTKANQKVELLKEKLNLTSLVALTKAEKSKSETFWTNCIGSGVAIDTVDGFLVAGQDNFFSWQDKSYVSIEEALKPKDKLNKLTPFGKYKLELLKKH